MASNLLYSYLYSGILGILCCFLFTQSVCSLKDLCKYLATAYDASPVPPRQKFSIPPPSPVPPPFTSQQGALSPPTEVQKASLLSILVLQNCACAILVRGTQPPAAGVLAGWSWCDVEDHGGVGVSDVA